MNFSQTEVDVVNMEPSQNDVSIITFDSFDFQLRPENGPIRIEKVKGRDLTFDSTPYTFSSIGQEPKGSLSFLYT